MRILGIETSCDETAAAVVETQNLASLQYEDRANNTKTQNLASLRVLSNVVSSQIEIHKKYGGVVPEVAAREHVLNILPVVNEALVKAGIKFNNPPTPFIKRAFKKSPQPPFTKGGNIKIDAIAVTIGPGLITSLIVGIETAKVLSYAWDIPVVAVNHIEGHIYANFISVNSKSKITNSKQIQNHKFKIQNIKFPALILTVSGGHTMLVLMRGHGRYKIIGETRDDAAGEAFDKAAAMLGIGYPGGPIISKFASKCKSQITNHKSQINPKSQIPNSKQIILPRPMINSGDYDFSFSGLKTALLYDIKKNPNFQLQITNYCAEFQQAVIDVLISKTVKAAKEYKVKTIMLSGGVSANIELRKQMKENVECQMSNVEFLIPKMEYTTDNAAMIAAAGYYKARGGKFTPWRKLKVDCNAEL